MVAWQRRARLMTVAVGLTVSVAVFVTTRRREPPPVPPSIPRMDPAAVVESSGAFVRDVKGERERFRVEAERQLTYSDGRTKLMGVKVSVDRNGKTFVITGDEAEVGENQSSVQLTGNVHLTGSDGLKLDAASASYSEGEGIVRAPGPVTFSRGSMTGKGVDFTYDRERDMIGLADQTAIQIAPDKKDTAGADIKAGAALLARKEKFMTFEREVHIIRGSQIIDADRAVADLTEDEKYISALDLNGSSRIAISDAAPGGVTAMSAANINLAYAPNTQLIQRAVLAGGSTVKIAAEKKGNPEKTLVADSLQLALAPDGATLTSLNAHDTVSLDLPAPRGETSKNIRSTTFVANGDETHGLTAAVFSDGVEYRESGGTPPVQRLVRSRTLDAALGSGLDEIRDARFLGNVQFNDGSTQATAADVRYQTASGQVALSGKIGNADPHVTTDQMVVDAVKIDMTLEGPKMQASEAVRAVMTPAKPGVSAKDARKMPGLMQQDRPVYGWSNQLAYDGGSAGKADFSGQVRLTQGDTFVKGDRVIVETQTGNLTATGTVTSQFLVDQVNEATKKKESVRATGGGADMRYDDATRRVSYKTGAYLNGPQGAIKAGTVAVSLSQVGNDVERLEAETAVTLTETTRVTTGDKLIYLSKDESYTVSGKPAHMIDEGCHHNKGASLSFSKTTDNLRIEGNEDTRSETKTEGTCIEPRTN